MEEMEPAAASKVNLRRMVYSSPDDREMDRKLPPDLSMNRILKREAWYPYDRDMKESHACATQNEAYIQCFAAEDKIGWESHERVAACFSLRTDLMKCLVRANKAERAASSSA